MNLYTICVERLAVFTCVTKTQLVTPSKIVHAYKGFLDRMSGNAMICKSFGNASPVQKENKGVFVYS